MNHILDVFMNHLAKVIRPRGVVVADDAELFGGLYVGAVVVDKEGFLGCYVGVVEDVVVDVFVGLSHA